MKTARGFTLLEVLVAVSLSALLAVLAYSSLTSGVDAAEQIQVTASRIDEVDRGLQLLERDLAELVARSVVTPVDQDAELVGDGLSDGEPFVRFTRQGWSNPLHRSRSEIQRVEYRFSEGAVWRWHWLNLTGTTVDEPQMLELFAGVEEMQLRFLDPEAGGARSELGGSWRDVWEKPGSLPVAVEVILHLEDMGEVRRLFPLPIGI